MTDEQTAPQTKPQAEAFALALPIASPADLIKRHESVARLIQDSLTEGIDYGVIPGTGATPSLLKPGAERLCMAFGAVPEFTIVSSEIDHDREVRWQKKKKKWNTAFRGDKSFSWETEDGLSLGLYRYVIKCRLVRGDGRLLGEGIGACSSLESKFIDRPRDCENTVLKIAKKRAHVDSTLTAFSLSNRFTQDVEDIRENAVAAEVAPRAAVEQTEAPIERPQKPGYDGSSEQQKILQNMLKHRKVPEEQWEQVHNAMIGKNLPDLANVLKEITQ